MSGLFVVLEGGDGAGKSTQADLLVRWLQDGDREAVRTHEPGDSPIGPAVRSVLLSTSSRGMSPWAEALLYAADRAEHVAAVVRPALDRGAVVVSDRYLDSSVAYQGVSRGLGADRVEQISLWATDGLRPDLTVLLDLDPALALGRFTGPADRLESEPLVFHRQVRRAFLDLAARDPHRYLVLDATAPVEQVQDAIRARLAPLLPERAGSSS
jgi:dTMP kinase